jgi:dTMP kinase
MTKGKFIVLEGIDGSGKSIQFKKLLEYLGSKNQSFVPFDFPQYEKPSSYFAKEYLAGHYGSAESVGPKRASLFYALDRFDASIEIQKALDLGSIVLSNRYVASNMGHQGSSFKNKDERLEFFKWISNLEFEVLKIAKPDLNIFLHVPAEISFNLIQERERKGERGSAKRDILELSLDHLKNAEESYLNLVEVFKDEFCMIECAENGQIMTIDQIHVKIVDKVGAFLGIS